MLTINVFEALILASVFYNLSSDTSTFFSRGAVVFMMVLLNAFGSIVCHKPFHYLYYTEWKDYSFMDSVDLCAHLIDRNFLLIRKTKHRRQTQPLRSLPPKRRSHIIYDCRPPIQNRECHVGQSPAIFHGESSTRTRPVLFLLPHIVHDDVGDEHVLSVCRFYFQDHCTSPGPLIDYSYWHGVVHWICYSCQIYAR